MVPLRRGAGCNSGASPTLSDCRFSHVLDVAISGDYENAGGNSYGNYQLRIVDGDVDMEDFVVFAGNWLVGT